MVGLRADGSASHPYRRLQSKTVECSRLLPMGRKTRKQADVRVRRGVLTLLAILPLPFDWRIAKRQKPWHNHGL